MIVTSTSTSTEYSATAISRDIKPGEGKHGIKVIGVAY